MGDATHRCEIERQIKHSKQDWTPEHVMQLVGIQARRIDYGRIAKRIADAHNAALAAERQRKA